MNKLLFVFLLLIFGGADAYEYKLSVAAITKNENPYLKEWIDYHLLVGVEHFYLYDNNDDRALEGLLEEYVQKGTIEIIPWPNWWGEIEFIRGCQTFAYQDALTRSIQKTEWLAIIDTDEFLVPMKDDSLVDVLDKHYNGHGFIYVSWLMFGTNNKKVPPGSPILPNLTKCAASNNEYNAYGKTICRPELTKGIQNVHLVRTDFPYINGSGKMMANGEHRSKYIRLNHYMLRDENFLKEVKIPRYASMWGLDVTTAKLFLHALNRAFCIKEDYRVVQLLLKLGQ